MGKSRSAADAVERASVVRLRHQRVEVFHQSGDRKAGRTDPAPRGRVKLRRLAGPARHETKFAAVVADFPKPSKRGIDFKRLHAIGAGVQLHCIPRSRHCRSRSQDQQIAAGSAGTAIAALGIGALGLLYKSNRFAGFVIGTLIALGLMFAGANAQTSCQFDGVGVKLCDVPDGWYTVTPRAHASAEFRRDDGFFAQLIIDAAGSDQGLTLSTVPLVAPQFLKKVLVS